MKFHNVILYAVFFLQNTDFFLFYIHHDTIDALLFFIFDASSIEHQTRKSP